MPWAVVEGRAEQSSQARRKADSCRRGLLRMLQSPGEGTGHQGNVTMSHRARVPQPPSRLAIRVVTPAVPAKERQASNVLKLPGKPRDRVTFKWLERLQFSGRILQAWFLLRCHKVTREPKQGLVPFPTEVMWIFPTKALLLTVLKYCVLYAQNWPFP